MIALATTSLDLRLLERLLDVVEGAQLDRLDGAVDRAVRGDHDDRHVGVLGHHAPQEAHAVEARHAQVGDERGDVLVAVDERQGLLAVARLEHLVAVTCEDGAEHFAQVQLVVGEDDAGSRHACNAITLK